MGEWDRNAWTACYNSGMKIFISYAEKDKGLASQFANQLAQAGFAAWNATEEIAPGDNWSKERGQALDESDVMVALITRGALKSDESLLYDIQYGLTSKNFERRLVPVLIDYATFVAGKEVPWILLKMNPVYLKSAPGGFEGFEDVVHRLSEIARQETNAPC